MHFTEYDTRLAAYAIVTDDDGHVLWSRLITSPGPPPVMWLKTSSVAARRDLVGGDYSLPPMSRQRIVTHMTVAARAARSNTSRDAEGLTAALCPDMTMCHLGSSTG